MKLPVIISFALRDVSKSKTVLCLTILSLGVGFAAILISSSVLEGFSDMLSRGEIGWVAHVLITPPDNEITMSDDKIYNIQRELNSIENVKSYSVRTYGIMGIKYNNKFISPFKAVGVSADKEIETSKLEQNLVSGTFVSASRPKEVVLGLELADALKGLSFDNNNISVGEEIEVITLSGSHEKYKICGITDAKTFLPNWLLIFDKGEIERLDPSQKNGEMIVRLKNPAKMDETISAIKSKNINANVFSWRNQSGYIDDIMETVSFMTVLINRLLNVSVFVIVSVIIFINVLQKKRQIGVIKSMGGSNKTVITIYIIETFVYAILAYSLGLLIFLAAHAYSISHPISLLIGDFYTIIDAKVILNSLFTLFVAALFGGLVPALMASKTQIIDVIRGNA